MKKTIHIPKINIVTIKKRKRKNFKGFLIYPPTEKNFNKNQNKLILIQRMFLK